ncbi:MAG: putative peptidoglycan lipid II flippase [Verrucomicrobiales bacterium]|jgi:putative peptidoglycan lipid II flippase
MATVSGFTALSRVLGFARDIFMARYLGTGHAADAFFAAFRFPNMFRRIFGEGAFNAAFVPLFAREMEEKGKEEAVRFANNAFSFMVVVLGVLTVIAIPLMFWILSAVVPGFKASEKSPQYSAGSAVEEFHFKVNVRGAKEIYFTLEGDASLVSIEEAKLSAGERDGWLDKLGEKLSGERKALPDDGMMVELSELAANQRLARKWKADIEQETGESRDLTEGELVEIRQEVEKLQIAERLTGLGDDEDGAVSFELPKEHDYRELTGVIRTTPGDGAGARFKIYRNHPGTFTLTVKLTQIMFVYLLCMALAAQLSGVLNTVKIFGMPAAAPIFLNLIFLIGLLIVVPIIGWKKDPVGCSVVVSWCVFVAGFVQLGALLVTCWRKGLPIRFCRPRMSPRIKKLFMLMGPGVAAAGIQQINLLIGGIIASFQEGAISFLYFSERVYQLPLGMIGIAMGVVLLPEVTRRLRGGDEAGAVSSMNRGIELALLITLPAAVAMIVMPSAIISTLFERNAFTAEDTRQTSLALAGFAMGLPGYVLIKVLQPGYFAREDTKRPMKMAGITVAVNIIVSLMLFPVFRHVGVAVATAVAAWVNVLLLAVGLRGFWKMDAKLLRKLPRVVLASVLMGVVIYFVQKAMGERFSGTQLKKTLGLGVLITIGMASYAGWVLALGVTSLGEFKRGFKRG